ncbi:unnamed protein product [Effrenium voratum]|nr:unnamed protein product [Effrenium voratum]
MTWGHATLAKHLSGCLSQDIRAAVDLSKQEAVLQKSLDDAVSAVVGGKRLLLFKRLPEITHFPDMRVVEIMMKGVDLTGIEPESPLFARKFCPASTTEPVLEKAAVWRRRRLMGSSKEDKTGEEGKERVIDDLKESCVNACYASVSKLDLHDVDFVSALFLFVAKLRVRLASGQELVGHVHESVRADSALQARCLDLSKAYKQVPVAPSSHKRAVLGVRANEGAWEFYVCQSLPFGASASVFEFNKILWWILVVRYNIAVANYFDDYPMLAFRATATSVDKAASSLLTLLGWSHAQTGKKGAPFSQTAVVLGASFNVSALNAGKLTVENKPERLERIVKLVKEFMQSEGRKSLASSIHGLLNYASGFVLGLALKMYTNVFAGLAAGKLALEEHVNRRLDELLELLPRQCPRCIQISTDERPCVIYTDGAFEASCATWGYVFLDPASNYRVCKHGWVPNHMRDFWLRTVGEQIIAQTEMYAVVCALWDLQERMLDRRALLFIDNESCRFALIKRASRSSAVLDMLKVIGELEMSAKAFVWFERVASFTNPADWPSRLDSASLPGELGVKDGGRLDLPEEVWRRLTKEPRLGTPLVEAGADTEVHRLINEQRLQDAAREALELAVMGREDPRELAIQAIHAASSPRAELGATIKVKQQPAAPAPCRPSTPQQLRLLHLLPAILNLFRSQVRFRISGAGLQCFAGPVVTCFDTHSVAQWGAASPLTLVDPGAFLQVHNALLLGDDWEAGLIRGGHAGQYAMAFNYRRDAMARPFLATTIEVKAEREKEDAVEEFSRLVVISRLRTEVGVRYGALKRNVCWRVIVDEEPAVALVSDVRELICEARFLSAELRDNTECEPQQLTKPMDALQENPSPKSLETLRDVFHPDGLPNLASTGLATVQSANGTFEATAEIALDANWSLATDSLGVDTSKVEKEVAGGWLAIDDDHGNEDKILVYRFAGVQRNKDVGDDPGSRQGLRVPITSPSNDFAELAVDAKTDLNLRISLMPFHVLEWPLKVSEVAALECIVQDHRYALLDRYAAGMAGLRNTPLLLQSLAFGSVLFCRNSRASYFDDASPDVREEAPACEGNEAVLKARLTEACLPEGNVNVLLGKQITTLRKLAYSVCTPTATASDAQLNALVKTSETEEVGVAILAAIRQVHFEAQTLAVAALKNLVEPKKDSAATELPFVERNERIRLQKGRLQGLDLSGALENAHSNYDLVFAMREQNSLKYLGPAKFPSRKQEVMQEKCLQELKVDSSGSIVFSEKKKDMEAELGTELLMRDALTRRALSFDLVLARVRTDPSVVYHLLQAPVSQKQVCAKTQSRVGAAHAVTMCVLSWATAEEVAYPPDLCKQWARAVVDELVELGAKPPPNEPAMLKFLLDEIGYEDRDLPQQLLTGPATITRDELRAHAGQQLLLRSWDLSKAYKQFAISLESLDTADDKGCDFSAVCIVLGLEVSIGPWDRAIVKVSNTEDRKLKLTAAIGILMEGEKCLAVFSYFMTNDQLQRVANVGSKNPIYELEAFADGL